MSELNNPAIYQTVLDALETGVYIVDPNRRIRFWNEGAEKITGYLRQDVVGHFLRDHLLTASDGTGDLDSDPNDPINVAFRDGKSSLMSVSILHKEGFRLPITLRTNPIRNSHGAVIGAAESFDKVQPFLDSTRRHSGLADFGCLDVLTGVAAQGFMDTKIRENLITFAEHHIPFGVLLLQIDDLDQHKTKMLSLGIGESFRLLRGAESADGWQPRATPWVSGWGAGISFRPFRADYDIGLRFPGRCPGLISSAQLARRHTLFILL